MIAQVSDNQAKSIKKGDLGRLPVGTMIRNDGWVYVVGVGPNGLKAAFPLMLKGHDSKTPSPRITPMTRVEILEPRDLGFYRATYT